MVETLQWTRLILLSVGLVCLPRIEAAQTPVAPQLLQPDARYKADLLLVVAHPDDDVLVGAYLARLVLDEHKRVAVVYCTSGDGGGNDVGNEAGAALGKLREMEARRALSVLGIENVWFLGHHDTPGQNVLRSLDEWNHGLALDEVVRLVRITRPEVILTWLPDVVAGEDHEDHQASGVLATEAFDAAADATMFPEQISPARDRVGMSNLTEGLLPWQAKKIYYMTDAFENFSPYWSDAAALPAHRKNILDATGPAYDSTAISATRHVEYAQLEAEQQAAYRTQEGALGEKALAAKNFRDFEFPIRLILGKSLVGGTVRGDVFEGLSPQPLAFIRTRQYEAEKRAGLSLEIGDPWSFYSRFWKAHDLDRVANLIAVPELASRFGDALHIPLLACNTTDSDAEFTVAAALPAGWTDETGFSKYPVRTGECYPILAEVRSSARAVKGWQELSWTATADSHAIGSVKMRIYLGTSGSLPQ